MSANVRQCPSDTNGHSPDTNGHKVNVVIDKEKDNEKKKEKTTVAPYAGHAPGRTDGYAEKRVGAMDDKGQAAGEKRVREHLIEPLLALGLARPTTLTNAAFETMLRTLAQTLAHMSAEELADLKAWVQDNPGGPQRDRFPIAVHILDGARAIRPPEQGGASPFLRRVMASSVGEAALAGGYAPELLEHARANRGKWPGPFTVTQLQAKAREAFRRFEDLQVRESRNEELTAEECRFLAHRRAQIDRCRQIAALGKDGERAA